MSTQTINQTDWRPWRRRLGAVMRVLGVLGIIACVIIFVALLFLPAQVIPFATDVATNLAEGLRTISESMASTSASLRSASDVLDTAASTLESISETVRDTKPLLESAATVIGDVGENTLEKTNQALATAQSAASAVDSVLRGLAILPIGINYDPDRSLGDSLADVADGLAPLPEGLIDVSGKIQNTADGFDDISGGLDRTGSDIQELSDNIRSLGERLGILSSSLEEQAETLDELVERIPTMQPGGRLLHVR